MKRDIDIDVDIDTDSSCGILLFALLRRRAVLVYRSNKQKA